MPASSRALALVNLLKTMIGAGLLTLPYATSQVGLILSFFGLAVLAFLSQVAIRMCVRCAAYAPSARKALLGAMRESALDAGLAASLRQTGEEEARASVERLSSARVSRATDASQGSALLAFAAASPAGAVARDSTVVDDGHGAGSWQIIAQAAYGTRGRLVTVIALIVAQFGTSTSYLDFCVTTLTAYTPLGSYAALGAVSAALWVACWLRQLRSVALLSAVALAVYGFVLALLFLFGAERIECAPPCWAPPCAAPPPCNGSSVEEEPSSGDAPAAALRLARWAGLGAWFGPSLFAFEGMGTALSIYESMETADPAPFFWVVSAGYVVTFALYVGVGSFAYIAWGDGVASVVIDSFTAGPLRLAAHVALSLILGLSFVLQMTPVFHISEDLLLEGGSGFAALPRWAWPLVRLGWVALAALVAAAVPDMEMMVSLTGAVAFSAIGFVLPGLFFLRLRPQDPRAPVGRARERVDVAVALLLVVVGSVGGVWGVASIFLPS